MATKEPESDENSSTDSIAHNMNGCYFYQPPAYGYRISPDPIKHFSKTYNSYGLPSFNQEDKRTMSKNMKFIDDRCKRGVTFSKRKKGIMKKAYELNLLTGSQVLLLVCSESGHVYTFATTKLKPIICQYEHLIHECLKGDFDDMNEDEDYDFK